MLHNNENTTMHNTATILNNCYSAEVSLSDIFVRIKMLQFVNVIIWVAEDISCFLHF